MSEWIKCSERLPETGKPVLVLLPNRKYQMDHMLTGFRAEHSCGGWYWEQITGEPGIATLSNVTHWQPLPEPPEEESEK